jgi:hypothetical protein
VARTQRIRAPGRVCNVIRYKPRRALPEDVIHYMTSSGGRRRQG